MDISTNRMASGITWAPGTNWLPMLLLGGCVVVIGLMTPILGTFAGGGGAQKVLLVLLACALIAIGGVVTLTRKEPIQFAFVSLLVILPFVAIPVPPGRLQLTIFDVAMLLITTFVIFRQAFSLPAQRWVFFPAKSAQLAMLLLIPAVLFSGFPVLSSWTFVEIFTLYVFFLLVVRELQKDSGLQRIAVILGVAILVVAIGVFIERLFKVNLSLRTANANLLTQLGGLEIRRGAGFFQDPQKAAQFLGCGIVFLLLLAVRRRFENKHIRRLLWISVVVGSVALVATISRGALLATLAVGGGFALFFSRGSAAVKLIVVTVIAGLSISLYLAVPNQVWLNLMPTGVAERLATIDASIENRLYLWFLAKDAFTNHPMTGVGLGAFGPYLMETRETSFLFTGGQNTPLLYILGQPESGYLKIAYEGGVFAVLALLVVVGDVVRRIFRSLSARSGATYDEKTDIIATTAGLLVFAITFVTLFTLSDERNAAILAILLAVLCSRSFVRALPKKQITLAPSGRLSAQ